MAKAKRGKKSGKRRAKKRTRRPSMSPAQKRATVAKRAQLHKAATLLKDFHGGKLPIKSGCGRPRKRR